MQFSLGRPFYLRIFYEVGTQILNLKNRVQVSVRGPLSSGCGETARRAALKALCPLGVQVGVLSAGPLWQHGETQTHWPQTPAGSGLPSLESASLSAATILRLLTEGTSVKRHPKTEPIVIRRA